MLKGDNKRKQQAIDAIMLAMDDFGIDRVDALYELKKAEANNDHLIFETAIVYYYQILARESGYLAIHEKKKKK